MAEFLLKENIMKKVKILFACSGICLFFSLVFFFMIPTSPNEYDFFEATESNTTEYTGTIRSITSDREGYTIRVKEHDIALLVSFDWGPNREVLQKLRAGDNIFYRFYIGTTIEFLEDFGAEQTPIVMLKANEGVVLSLEDFNEFRRNSFKQLDNFGYAISLSLFLGSVILFVRGLMVRKKVRTGKNN